MKSCETCKYGVPDKHCLDGIRCDGNHAHICLWIDGLEKFNKWEPKEETTVRHTLKQWERIKGIEILDYDGFDRTDNYLMFRMFTEAEFDKGVMLCTCRFEAKKEESKMEKTYSNREMLELLAQNKERTAVSQNKNHMKIFGDGMYQGRMSADDRWTITEPEPVQVEFWQAYKILCTTTGKSVESVVSGKLYGSSCNQGSLYHCADEELQGKWIVKEAGV